LLQAISAGLGAVMCSFNLECVDDLECVGVNATLNARHSCGNHNTLQRDLKGRLKFQGYVMSDWDAAHSSSINEGLDMEMPDGKWLNQSKLLAMLAAGDTTRATIAESAARILWGLFETGLMDRPNANGSVYRNVSTVEHIQLARSMAATSSVLLQNKGGILPLNVVSAMGAGATQPAASDSSGSVREIAVIGAQALHPTFHSSGSGQVAAAYAPAPLDSLRDALGVPAGEECRADKTVCVRYNTGGNHPDAAKLAAAADVAIVFVACTGSEGQDRPNLTLSGGADAVGGQDALISVVAAAAANRTVVVAVTPGAILTPWRDSVAAIIAAFMPGQEYGHAIADVLLGRTAPAGKLPVTFPAEENQADLTWGGNRSNHHEAKSVSSNHSERLEIGYRWFDAHASTPAFPFGHGLPGYSTFAYADLVATATSVRFTLKNTGAVAAAETPQLYLSFPSSAREPPWQLKGFEKTALAPGGKATVVFPLTVRDLSVWSVHEHAWTAVRGAFEVAVGSSSRDHRLVGSITVKE
jgi:beta-glucosidase